MIKRNDAYSNLVELMFPFHLRFSIHAHCNSGPKFGISLLSKTGDNQCRPINTIQDHKEPRNTDLLHIPTHGIIQLLKLIIAIFISLSNQIKLRKKYVRVMVVVGGILITFIIFSLVINSINNKKPINRLEIFFFVWL